MKISVITLQNISNYGSVLQADATQMFFKSMGHETEIVDYWRENMIDRNIAHDLVLHKNLKFKNIWGKTAVTRNIAEVLLSKKIEKRAGPFRRFVRENLNVTKTRYISDKPLKESPPQADVYCVGSDQVWNSDWNGKFDESFYLSYAPSGKPKIAFSSSFGLDSLPEWESERVKELLSDFSIVTVREASAVKMLEKLGINATLFLDPTLLVGRKTWENLVDERIGKSQPYILVYQLNDTPEFDSIVEKAAELFGKKIVRIEYRKTEKMGEHIVLPEIREWVSYFYYADNVITDSFHGTVFSMMFGKKFIDVFPKKFSGRIESILKLTGLEERHIENAKELSIMEKKIEYQKVFDVLEKEAEKAKNIISKVMGEYE